MTYEVTTLTPAYVDVHGACKFTSLSRRTLDYAKSEGELPYIRKGRKILFKVADLEKWMDDDRLDITDAVARLEGGGHDE